MATTSSSLPQLGWSLSFGTLPSPSLPQLNFIFPKKFRFGWFGLSCCISPSLFSLPVFHRTLALIILSIGVCQIYSPRAWNFTSRCSGSRGPGNRYQTFTFVGKQQGQHEATEHMGSMNEVSMNERDNVERERVWDWSGLLLRLTIVAN